jgi:hypothetical protein
MTISSIIPTRKTLVILILFALPVLACNPLSGADEEAEEIAAAVAEGIATAGQEAFDALDEEDSAETGEQSSEEQSSEEQSSTGDESPEAVAEALRTSLTVDAMRIHITSEDLTNGVISEISIAFIQPDRYQMTSEGTEIIVIGDTSYLGTGDGEWTESPVAMTDLVEQTLASFFSPEAMDVLLETVDEDWSKLRSLGREEINGVETQGYEYEENSVAQFSSLLRMWIGVKDGLLYRQEIESDLGGLQNRTLMDFSYGDDVTIEPPI